MITTAATTAAPFSGSTTTSTAASILGLNVAGIHSRGLAATAPLTPALTRANATHRVISFIGARTRMVDGLPMNVRARITRGIPGGPVPGRIAKTQLQRHPVSRGIKPSATIGVTPAAIGTVEGGAAMVTADGLAAPRGAETVAITTVTTTGDALSRGRTILLAPSRRLTFSLRPSRRLSSPRLRRTYHPPRIPPRIRHVRPDGPDGQGVMGVGAGATMVRCKL